MPTFSSACRRRLDRLAELVKTGVPSFNKTVREANVDALTVD